MLPAAGEGEVCRQPKRKAVVRPAAAVRGTVKATTVGCMEVSHDCESGVRDPLQNPWKMLISFTCEGKSLTNHT